MIKYFIIILLLSTFLIAFVWQNIEVVQIRLEYNKMQAERSNLYRQNDILKVEIEKLRSIPNVQRAVSNNERFRQITPADIDSLRAD